MKKTKRVMLIAVMLLFFIPCFTTAAHYINVLGEGPLSVQYNASVDYITSENVSWVINTVNASGLILNWSNIITGGGNTSWNQTVATSLYAPINEPIAASLGNWSADQTGYATTATTTGLQDQITSTGNWTQDKTSYYTTTQTDNNTIIRNTNTSWAITAANASGNIKNWDPSGYIKDWNASAYIKDWNSSGLILNYSDIITATGGNTSFNQSLTDTLYYEITTDDNNIILLVNNTINTTGYIKDWNASGNIYNWNATAYIKNWNASGNIYNWNATAYIKDWNATGYIREPAWNTTGTNVFLANTADKVGIGLASPTSVLHISSTSTQLELANSTGSSNFSVNSAGNLTISASGGNVIINLG